MRLACADGDFWPCASGDSPNSSRYLAHVLVKAGLTEVCTELRTPRDCGLLAVVAGIVAEIDGVHVRAAGRVFLATKPAIADSYPRNFCSLICSRTAYA